MLPRALTLSTWYQLPVLAVASAVSFVVWPRGAVGVLAGGVLMGLNFWALRYLMGKVFVAGKPNYLYVALLAGKFLLVMLLIPLLMWALQLDAAGFMVGLLTVFVGVGLALVHTRRSPSPG